MKNCELTALDRREWLASSSFLLLGAPFVEMPPLFQVSRQERGTTYTADSFRA